MPLWKAQKRTDMTSRLTVKPEKAALIFSSGSDQVYDGAIYEYQNSFLDYLKLEWGSHAQSYRWEAV